MTKRLPKKTNREINRVKLAVLVLVVLILLIGLSKIISLVSSFSRPYSPDGLVADKGYSWDGHSTINLVVKGEEISVLSFNPSEQSLTVLKIPDEAYLNLPFEYGKWAARSIYGLGQSEEQPKGANLLEESIRYSFNMPIDGYLILSSSRSSESVEKIIDDIRGNPLKGLSLINSSKTDLTFWELLNFFKEARGVRFDRVTTVDFGSSPVTRSKVLPDGNTVLEIDPGKLDLLIQKNFKDGKLHNERLSIGILNTTDTAGLAEKAAKVVTNMGGRVIFTANSKAQLSQSTVLGAQSYTKSRLSQIFAPSCIDKSCKTDDLEKEFLRADVNIVLGKDFSAKFSKPDQ